MINDKQQIKILVADDEQDIRDLLYYNLAKEGYQVQTVENGLEAVEKTASFKPHLIILDLMMPKMDGIEACIEIRKLPLQQQPVITFLTSRNEDYSQVAGFESGADDYIFKPIRIRLLFSKVTSLIRRLNLEESTIKANKSIIVDKQKYIVSINGIEHYFPKKEFELLDFLMKSPEKVFNRDEILENVWGNDTFVGERTVDVHVRKLREKLGEKHIRTIKGVGYTFINIEK